MIDLMLSRVRWRLSILAGLVWLTWITPGPALAQEWTQFEMNQKDARGDYLWTESANWNRGLPGAELSVEIGDDHSGRAEINVGDIEFWGNKFKDAVNTKTGARVKVGLSVLKLTGDGVSTIHARKIDFIDAAVLDVSGLRIAPGTYTVIDGKMIGADNLRFAPGTDGRKWSLRFDRPQGDVLLIFHP